jgi:hypothetical protein
MLFAATANAREPDVGGFKSYAMPAYTIITHDENSAREVPSAVAKIESLLAAVIKSDGPGNAAPTYIVLAPQNLWTDYLEPGTGIVGEFVPGRFVNYVLLRNCRCESNWVRESLFHEYTHLYLHSHYRGIIPLWFDEGMAQLVELTDFHGARANFGKPPAMQMGWLPLNRLLRLDKSSPEYRSDAFTYSVHSESWALVHRGMIADAAFGKQMFAYLDAINDLQPIDEAVQSSFGVTVAQLSRDLYRYVRRSSFTAKWLKIEWTEPETLKPGRSMSELESLELLADVMFVSGFKPQRLADVVDTAYRRAPASPSVRVLRMRLAARDRDDAALDRLLQEIEPQLADPQIARGAGLALFERLRDQDADHSLRAENRTRLSAKALELIDRYISVRSGDAEAIWAYGMLAAREKRDLTTALERVKQMIAVVPFNPDLAMAAALLQEARGETQETISYLIDTAHYSASLEQRVWARDRLVAIGNLNGK